MAQLYTWETTQKKQMPDGSIQEFEVRQTGRKPPKTGAKNIRKAGPKPAAKPAADKTAKK